MDNGNIQQDDNEIAQKTIRAFSWKAYAENPDDSLIESLVIAEENTKLESEPVTTLREQWMQLFDPASKKALNGGKEDMILADPTEELAKVYQNFLKCLPKDHAARVEDGPPDLRVVVEALTVAELNWKNNREKTRAGRMKALFGKLSINVTKFKDVFAVIPSGDKYVCLMTGSISAIVKATVNHEKIAESVSTALDDLGEDIAYWQELLKANDYSARVEHYVARLFVVVFKFLANIMTKWSSKSATGRMFRSFDSDFFKEEIEMKRAGIKDLERKLNRHADLDRHREMRTCMEANTACIKEVSAMQEKLTAGLVLSLGKHERSLGLSVKRLLEQGHLNMQREIALALNTPTPSDPIIRQTMEKSAAGEKEQQDRSPSYYEASQVRTTALVLLRPWVVQQQEKPLEIAKPKTFSMHREVLQKIQLWNATSASQRLWIVGPYQVSKPSQYTRLSAHVVK